VFLLTSEEESLDEFIVFFFFTVGRATHLRRIQIPAGRH